VNVDLAASARRAVLDQLARAHDHWSEEEQRLAVQDQHYDAEGAHQLVGYVMRAYQAELNDPKPREAAI